MKESEILANKIRSLVSYRFISEKDFEKLKKLFREAEAAKAALQKMESARNIYDANMMKDEAQGCFTAEKILDNELKKAAVEPEKPPRPKQTTCKTCKYLDLNDHLKSLGYKCNRPRWKFRSITAQRKQKTSKSCTSYEKREDSNVIKFSI